MLSSKYREHYTTTGKTLPFQLRPGMLLHSMFSRIIAAGFVWEKPRGPTSRRGIQRQADR